MKLSVLGSRSINDWKLVNSLLRKEVVEGTVVLGGSAKGVDTLVKEWCLENEVDFIEFLPYHMIDKNVDFTTKYFFLRNKQLVDNADKVLAIWDEETKDTEYAIKYAQKKNIPVLVVKHPINRSNPQEGV